MLFRTCRHTKGKGIIYFLFSVCLSVVIFFSNIFLQHNNSGKKMSLSLYSYHYFEVLLGCTKPSNQLNRPHRI